MQARVFIGVWTATMALASTSVWAEKPVLSEKRQAAAWAADHFNAREIDALPFRFMVGATTSGEFLKSCKTSQKREQLPEGKTLRTIVFFDAKSRLKVTCLATVYKDYPVVEWKLQFKNEGGQDSPAISDIKSMAVSLQKTGKEDFLLHWNNADNCAVDSYAPNVKPMKPGDVFEVAPLQGWPTSGNYPFWNLEYDGGGTIAVIGWPGQWSMRMSKDMYSSISLLGGQELTHFVLHPGEEVRSPLSVLLFYNGDWIRGQNVWRRWIVNCNLPRPGGKLVPTHYAACFANLQPVPEEEIGSIEGFTREGIKLDYWILDAGWYVNRGHWWNTGTWEVDRERFPNGVKAVSDAAHKNGLGFVLWFEPERCTAGSWLADNHPEWVSGGKNGGAVFIGNPDCWKWIVETFDGLIKSEGVDVYRQDHNIAPMNDWRAHDTPDRQGITEIKDVTGYLAYWDELLKRHPNMWIDSCSGGGRRNDLETMRRSVPLLRSDAFDGPIVQQCQTYGLSLWLPYFGSGTGFTDEYMYRSCIFPASRVGGDARDTKLDYKLFKRMLAEFRKLQPYLLDDYYPLTPYSTENSVWIGWQLNSPEKGGGYALVFRREEAGQESMVVKLKGLNAKATYEVEDMNTGKTERLSGKRLMAGIEVKLPKRASALYIYKKSK